LSILIKDDIKKGTYKIGEKFLSEREISELYQINRATANKALFCLVAEGILEYRKGLGTFIKSLGLDYDLRRLVSFSDKARIAGKVPSTRILAFERERFEAVGVEARTRLELSRDDEVYYFSRLRLADNIPMILEKRWVPVKFCPDLLEKDLGDSIYRLFTEKYGFTIIGADETIMAVLIQEPAAGLLSLSPGKAGLLVHSLGYADNNRPLWWEETLYNGDLYEFRNTLGPVQQKQTFGFFRDVPLKP
jgi:GntR family transcriptional regulator